MGPRLVDYVSARVPLGLLAKALRVEVVAGDSLGGLHFHRASNSKRFNYLRPAFTLGPHKVLTCVVPPGSDYLYHYGRLIATALHITGSTAATYVNHSTDSVRDSFIDRHLPALGRAKVAILGYVEQLSLGGSWHSTGAFATQPLITDGQQRTLLIGSKVSFWGDLGGSLVRGLGERGIDYVIYVGKAGALRSGIVPNLTLATGTTSAGRDGVAAWATRLQIEEYRGVTVLTGGRHVGLPSPVDETIPWYESCRSRYDLLESEVHSMARSAAGNMDFDYLHIVSDVLGDNQETGLHNERSNAVRDNRRASLAVARSIILKSLAE